MVDFTRLEFRGRIVVNTYRDRWLAALHAVGVGGQLRGFEPGVSALLVGAAEQRHRRFPFYQLLGAAAT